MCVDFIYLNKTCPKDSYYLSEIDRLVDSIIGFEYLSFLDVNYRYHQILMHLDDDDEKIAFIINEGIFYYRVMPSGFKNDRATY